VQRWLSESEHSDAGNPYFLVRSRQSGSLAALLSYPVLIEPWMTLSSQRAAWSVAYAMLVLVIAISLVIIARMRPPGVRDLSSSAGPAVRRSQRARLGSILAIPASLLVGVTTFISTDVAAVPLLWVLPLSIYLLTFAIVFSRRPLVRHSWMVRPRRTHWSSSPFRFSGNATSGALGVAVHLVVLFIVRHGVSRRARPAPAACGSAHEFYVWVGVGGLVGGSSTPWLHR